MYEEDCLSTEAGPAVETGVRGPPPGSRTCMILQVVPQVVLPGEHLPAQTTPEYRLGEANAVRGLDMVLPGLSVSEGEAAAGAEDGLGPDTPGEGVGVQVTWRDTGRVKEILTVHSALFHLEMRQKKITRYGPIISKNTPIRRNNFYPFGVQK